VETQAAQQLSNNAGASMSLLSHNFDAFDVDGDQAEFTCNENPVERNKNQHCD
jgi:hypothetical protein